MATSNTLLVFLGFLLAIQAGYADALLPIAEVIKDPQPECQEALYIKAGVSALLETMSRNKNLRINDNLLKRVWKLSEDCIDQIAQNVTQRKIFLEYCYMEHFVHLQIVRARDYFYNTRVTGRAYQDLFKSLIDPRFLSAVDYGEFPYGSFFRRKEAAKEAIKIACGEEKDIETLPRDVNRKIKGRVIRKIFLALIRDGYIGNIVNPFRKSRNWNNLGKLMKEPGSSLQNSCFDMKVVEQKIDPVIEKIRKIAAEDLEYTCDQHKAYILEQPMFATLVMPPMKMSYMSYQAMEAPLQALPKMSSGAPDMQIPMLGSAPQEVDNSAAWAPPPGK